VADNVPERLHVLRRKLKYILFALKRLTGLVLRIWPEFRIRSVKYIHGIAIGGNLITRLEAGAFGHRRSFYVDNNLGTQEFVRAVSNTHDGLADFIHKKLQF
jgi:hypothetical protein